MSFAILNQPPSAIDALPALLQPIALHGLAKDVAHRYPDAKRCLPIWCWRAHNYDIRDALDEPTLTRATPSTTLKDVISHASTPRWQSSSSLSATSKRKARRAAPPIYSPEAVAVLAAGSLLFSPVRQRAAALLSGTGGKARSRAAFDNIGTIRRNEAIAEASWIH